MTTVVDNLIAGIKARGPSVSVDIANVTQASPAAWLLGSKFTVLITRRLSCGVRPTALPMAADMLCGWHPELHNEQQE